MSKRQKQAVVEAAFIISLLGLCAILTALQFHWTGELSRAESEKLNATLDDQVRMVTEAFDEQLSAACSRFQPWAGPGPQPPPGEGPGREPPIHNGAPVAEGPWAARSVPKFFRRVAVAVPQGKRLALFFFPFDQSPPRESSWPTAWEKLHQNLLRKVSRLGSSPYRDDSGLTFEFPVLGANGPERESGWVIFQIDDNYLRSNWLPGLIRQFLGKTTADQMRFEVTANPSQSVVFSQTGEAWRKGGRAFLSVDFNHFGRMETRPPGMNNGGAWKMKVYRDPDTFETAVTTARMRNLGVALAVNGLIVAAGIALVRYTGRSRQLAEAQMTFVATVSHELRTPLTVIRGAAQNLERGVIQDPPRVQIYAKLIDDHADQLSEMVEQILQKTGARQNRLSFENVNVAALAEEAVAATATEVGGGRCSVKFEKPEEELVVDAEPDSLRRAFQNLIINAVNHGGPGKEIELRVRPAYGFGKAMVEVTISDEGPGIPEADREQIFEPFYRGQRARSQQVRGSGLGLNLVQETVEIHGGKISVSNLPEGGAKFTITLPRKTAQ